MRAAIGWLGGVFVALLVGAATVDVATRETPWYLIGLWIGAAISGTLVVILAVVWVVTTVLERLKAIAVRNDWRCTYWAKEQQLKVTVWFDDRLHSSRYKADCVVQVGQELIRLDDDIELGGTYLGRKGLVSGHSGPVMAEFLKKDIPLEQPQSATVRVRIQPREPWGATRQEAKTIPIQIISH